MTYGPVKSGIWRDRALCAEVGDTDLFFIEKGGSSMPAKRICARCEVTTECLADAVDRGDRFGIWGGTVEHERRHLVRHESIRR